MGSGKFWYNGIQKNLQSALTDKHTQLSQGISLIFNIDGFSPFNSSNCQFWPITFIVDEYREIPPLVAAIFYGTTKPPLESFFQNFVQELNEIIRTGIKVNGKYLPVKIKCFVCDTQARSFIKGTPGRNAENSSCIKCIVTGEWDQRGRHMSYPKIDCPKRTDLSFRNKLDVDHHKYHSPLTELPIDMIEDFVVADSLYLLDLGIMRRCLLGWREGSYNFKTKLSKQQTDSISHILEQCNRNKPIEIPRAIRAQKLIENYINGFIKIYGVDSVSSNVHNLCHVVDDVKKFGPLPSISSFPFENHLGYLKSLLRHGKLPLSQMAKRVIELSKLNYEVAVQEKVILKNRQNVECDQLPECDGIYNEVYTGKDFLLKVDEKNCYFMTNNNDIVVMINATYLSKEAKIYGKSIKISMIFSINLLLLRKCKKICADIGATPLLDTNTPRLYSLHEVKCKLFCINYHDEFVFMPLLHTLDLVSQAQFYYETLGKFVGVRSVFPIPLMYMHLGDDTSQPKLPVPY
nr:unnamed protein product [Callosobruchus analis]